MFFLIVFANKIFISRRKSAEAAEPLLTRKQYKKHQSQNMLQDFMVKNMEFKQNYLQVGSSDSHWPKGVKYSLRSNINGMKQYFGNAQAIFSSIRELTKVLYQQTEDQQSRQQSREDKWSSAKIAEALNLETTEREQLEGYIYTEMESMQRIWSFNNETIEQLPQGIPTINNKNQTNAITHLLIFQQFGRGNKC